MDKIPNLTQLIQIEIKKTLARQGVTLSTNKKPTVISKVTANPVGGGVLGTTDDLIEGSTNKYFTDERVDDRINNLLDVGDENLSLTYDDTLNTLTLALAQSLTLTAIELIAASASSVPLTIVAAAEQTANLLTILASNESTLIFEIQDTGAVRAGFVYSRENNQDNAGAFITENTVTGKQWALAQRAADDNFHVYFWNGSSWDGPFLGIDDSTGTVFIQRKTDSTPTANLLEFRKKDGTVLSYFDKDGVFHAP